MSIVSKSPLTGTLGDTSGGHKWPVYLKRAGYDALVVQGKADSPVYLWISSGEVEIRDARGLWGMDTVQTREALEARLGGQKKLGVVSIGPAGERLVRFACVAVDEHGFAGRTGLGAVMGSKNLKAIVVSPALECAYFDPDALQSLRKSQREIIVRNTGEALNHGTLLGVGAASGTGNLPVKYWSGDTWEDEAEEIGAPRYTEVLNVKPMGCLNCPIRCKRGITITEPLEYAMQRPGPQYESVALLGSACLVNDLEALCQANDICNRLGMDTISAGSCVAFAMECYERGWLTRDDLGGSDLRWGEASALIELVTNIGTRQGIGDLLAEGTVAAARSIGREAQEIVVHTRGLDFPAWDPRAFWGAAVNYATGSIGASHCKGMIVPLEFGTPLPDMGLDGETQQFVAEGKGLMAARSQDISAIMGSLSMCSFMVDWGGLKCADMTATLNAITGWNWSVQELVTAGERISTLQRLINVRDCRGKEHDFLPKRMFQAARSGPRAGKIPPIDVMLEDYCSVRGWDEDGVPAPATLERLGLGDYIER